MNSDNDMYTLLVVDDEKYAVKAIMEKVDWSELDFKKVLGAYSVNQAKHLFQTLNIDAMICDIEMIGSNGLELQEWVKQNYPLTETLFLTCHADFNYAQKAMHLGSFDYLLKPVDYEELKNVTAKMLQKVKYNREIRSFNTTLLQYQNLWATRKPLLIERFWDDVLSGHVISDIERQSTYGLNIPLDQEIMIVMVCVEQWKKPLNMEDENIMNYALRNAAGEMVLQSLEGHVIQDRKGNNLIVIYDHGVDNFHAQLSERCEKFIQACTQFFYCNLSCYISKSDTLKQLSLIYNQLQELRDRNVAKPNSVIFQNTVNMELPPILQIKSLGDWQSLIEMGKTDELRQRLKIYLGELERDSSISKEILDAFYNSILHMTYQIFHKRGLSLHGLLPSKAARGAEGATRSLASFIKWVDQFIHDVGQILAVEGTKHSANVEKMKEYIRHNLHWDFSREDVAGFVYLNSDYATRLFKKETGQGLLDYITVEKINKAKEELISSNLKISEIGESVGYEDNTRFSKVFKKVVGIAPQEYRKKFQNL